MAITLAGATSANGINAGLVAFTVPAGVLASHLGLIVITTTSNGGVAGWTIDDWTDRVQNPPGQGNSEFALFTRLGGVVAGDTVLVNSQVARTMSVSALWFDTDGRDISIQGDVGTRHGVSSATTLLPEVTTTDDGQDVLVIATERSSSTTTAITGWAPTTPTTVSFSEFSLTLSSHFFGKFVKATAGATGDYTATYNVSSPSAVGLLMAIRQPVTGWIKDPSAGGGKRAFIRRRNPAASEDVDGGVFSQTTWSGDYDGGTPVTVNFFDNPLNGGGPGG